MSDIFADPPHQSGLVGKFCLIKTGEDEDDLWQGNVISYFSAGYDQGHLILVQLFSWLSGCPTDQVLLKVSDLISSPGKYSCSFYTNKEELDSAAEKIAKRNNAASNPSL